MGKVRNAIIETLAGVGVSVVIFYVMLLVLVGGFANYFEVNTASLLWIVVFYLPYLIIGSVLFLYNWKVFGSTVLVSGIVGAIGLAGFVYGLGGTF